MSLLGKTTKEIASELSQISFPQFTVDPEEFSKFGNRKKTDYIRAFEQVYFPYSLFSSILRSMLFNFDALEGVKVSFTPQAMQSMTFEDQMKRSQLIVSGWQNFFLLITTMLSLLKDVPDTPKKYRKPLLSDKDFCTNYPELNYCRLLRNDFMQHPSLFLGMQSYISVISSNDPKYLPYYDVAPDGYGLTIYYNFFRKKVGKKFSKLTDEGNKEQNKIEYLKYYGWKPSELRKRKTKNNKRSELLLIQRIKGFGLPNPDQKRLAKELEAIFKKVVFPFLKRKQIQAKKWGFKS